MDAVVSGVEGTRQRSRMSISQTVIEFLPGYILAIVVNDFPLITSHPLAGLKGQRKCLVAHAAEGAPMLGKRSPRTTRVLIFGN